MNSRRSILQFVPWSLALACTLAHGPAVAVADPLPAILPTLAAQFQGLGSGEPASWSELAVTGAVAYRGSRSVTFVVDEAPADSVIRFPRLNNRVRAAVVLGQDGDSNTDVDSQLPQHYRMGDLCELTQSPSEWTIALPAEPEFPLTLELELDDEPLYTEEAFVATPSVDNVIVLQAHHAEVHGEKLQYEPLPHKNTVGYWANPDDWCEWSFAAPAGEYAIELLQGCGEGQGGSRVRMQVDGIAIDFEVVETGHFQNFRWREMGEVALTDMQIHQLSLKVLELAEFAVMDVRQVRLVPLDGPSSEATNFTDIVPDVVLPPLFEGPPSTGRRVVHTLPGASDDVYHTIYLPTDWREDRSYPVLVELPGNGGHWDGKGGVTSGDVEDAQLGPGLTGGDGWICATLPFLNHAGTEPVTEWWGDPPDYEVTATLDYWQRAIDDICQNYGGDPERLVLAGFSRGSIACNYLGLHDDSIAARWKGFVCNSHYDGVLEDWPYPDCDRDSALVRLRRLAGRPQLVISETSEDAGTSLDAVRRYLADSNEAGQWTFVSTGFESHTDEWALRPSAARQQVRQWLNELIEYEMQ